MVKPSSRVKSNNPLPKVGQFVELDHEVLRAQVANCLFQAVARLNGSNEGLDAELCLGRMQPAGAYFTIISEMGGERSYLLEVLDPSVGQMRLIRWDQSGSSLELDDGFDRALIAALSASVADTVVVAFEHMVSAGLKYPQASSAAIH